MRLFSSIISVKFKKKKQSLRRKNPSKKKLDFPLEKISFIKLFLMGKNEKS